MPAIAVVVRVERASRDRSRLGQPVAEPGDLGPIDDRPPCPVAGLLADVELDRVRADIDHRESGRLVVDEDGQASWHAGVDALPQAEGDDAGPHCGRILGLEGKRARVPTIDLDVGQLARAIVERVTDPPLVDGHDADRSGGLHELVEELAQRVGVPGEARHGLVKRLEHGGDGRGVEREAGLEDRLPLFEAVTVDLAKDLDVDDLGANLDVVTVLGQEVELVTLLDAGRCQTGQDRVRRTESRSEGPPLPAWNDLRHPHTLSFDFGRWRGIRMPAACFFSHDRRKGDEYARRLDQPGARRVTRGPYRPAAELAPPW